MAVALAAEVAGIQAASDEAAGGSNVDSANAAFWAEFQRRRRADREMQRQRGSAVQQLLAEMREERSEFPADVQRSPLKVRASSPHKACVTTMEENEEETYSQFSKLFRFNGSEWKESGKGEAKLLKHPKTGKVRFILRQETTTKVIANHMVVDSPPYCHLLPQDASGGTCWVWTAQDFADDAMKVEKLALKFGTPEKAESFKVAFEKSKLSRKVSETWQLLQEVQLEREMAASAMRSPTSRSQGSAAIKQTPTKERPCDTPTKRVAGSESRASTPARTRPRPSPSSGALPDVFVRLSSPKRRDGLGSRRDATSGANTDLLSTKSIFDKTSARRDATSGANTDLLSTKSISDKTSARRDATSGANTDLLSAKSISDKRSTRRDATSSANTDFLSTKSISDKTSARKDATSSANTELLPIKGISDKRRTGRSLPMNTDTQRLMKSSSATALTSTPAVPSTPARSSATPPRAMSRSSSVPTLRSRRSGASNSIISTPTSPRYVAYPAGGWDDRTQCPSLFDDFMKLSARRAGPSSPRQRTPSPLRRAIHACGWAARKPRSCRTDTSKPCSTTPNMDVQRDFSQDISKPCSTTPNMDVQRDFSQDISQPCDTTSKTDVQRDLSQDINKSCSATSNTDVQKYLLQEASTTACSATPKLDIQRCLSREEAETENVRTPVQDIIRRFEQGQATPPSPSAG